MNKYDPNKHHRRSIRLKGYDYSQPGAYFVTICTQNREHLFGLVDNGALILNEAGNMVQKWWLTLDSKFEGIEPDTFVVMPNHFHGIIKITPRLAKGEAEEAISVGRVIQWFKTMSTNEYIRGVKQHQWPPFPGKLWQRNYYEHIIHNEHVYLAVQRYIQQNPQRWWLDRFNPAATGQDPQAVKLWRMFN
jgi:REP element-mobilizing transposase RayT